ncbi:NADH dehydrogenase [ubiquinone] 1 alpha subcomplex assembly factor 2 isoform X1 [Ascaphus truei]|uniref:NADH dehydrogenase [ubiquinone] 1 alpha subcomplex assembly factor 2 isoform X1 n=1 Tax=Ascaphus truei TaxID=8439 RepID=UPI003F5AC695
MDKWRSFLQRMLGTVRQHVGNDQFGNKYYYVPEQKTWTGQTVRQRRMFDPVHKKAYEYELGHIPTEWEAWIRGKRKDPPTIEEILKNENLRAEMRIKGFEVSERDKVKQAEEYKDGLAAQSGQTQIKGHASAPVYGRNTPTEEPTSTANTFEPGSWAPPGASNTKK